MKALKIIFYPMVAVAGFILMWIVVVFAMIETKFKGAR